MQNSMRPERMDPPSIVLSLMAQGSLVMEKFRRFAMAMSMILPADPESISAVNA